MAATLVAFKSKTVSLAAASMGRMAGTLTKALNRNRAVSGSVSKWTVALFRSINIIRSISGTVSGLVGSLSASKAASAQVFSGVISGIVGVLGETLNRVRIFTGAISGIAGSLSATKLGGQTATIIGAIYRISGALSRSITLARSLSGSFTLTSVLNAVKGSANVLAGSISKWSSTMAIAFSITQKVSGSVSMAGVLRININMTRSLTGRLLGHYGEAETPSEIMYYGPANP